MRMHIELDDQLVADLDEVTGPRGRSAFVRAAIEDALAQAKRWAALEQSAGALASSEHDWDADPAAWVREQRQGNERRVG